jgi:hypothetical protein
VFICNKKILRIYREKSNSSDLSYLSDENKKKIVGFYLKKNTYKIIKKDLFEKFLNEPNIN